MGTDMMMIKLWWWTEMYANTRSVNWQILAGNFISIKISVSKLSHKFMKIKLESMHVILKNKTLFYNDYYL